MQARQIEVEVVYALPEWQCLLSLRVAAGSTVRDVIERSGLVERFGIDLAVNRTGVFGRLVVLDHLVEEGDRVEIYRPLTADPKIVRRKLAAEGRTMRRKAAPSP